MKQIRMVACALLLTLVLPMTAKAQEAAGHKTKHKHKKTQAASATARQLPPWAAAHNYDATAHVYFPDYYTFYDASRGGYVFWNGDQWSFTPTMPPFLEHVDMSKERIKILKGLDLDLHPEQNYPNYMKQYPAEHTYDNVPVPR